MYESGCIYRDNRLVNWDARLVTAVSDIEVDYIDIPGRTLINVPGYDQVGGWGWWCGIWVGGVGGRGVGVSEGQAARRAELLYACLCNTLQPWTCVGMATVSHMGGTVVKCRAVNSTQSSTATAYHACCGISRHMLPPPDTLSLTMPLCPVCSLLSLVC